MTEQERAAALAMIIESDGLKIVALGGDKQSLISDGKLVVSALRAYARPAPADLREAIIDLILGAECEDRGMGAWVKNPPEIADAILSLLPQTQEIADDLRKIARDAHSVGVEPADVTPLVASLRRLAARLDRATGKEG